MLDSNSYLREMMQNPEFLRQLASPETMQVYLFRVPKVLNFEVFV
jgi:ubiquilin